MTFLLAGVSYSDTPLHILERVAVAADDLNAHLDALSSRVHGDDSAVAIVSTCNRTEFYTVSDETDAGSALEEMSGYLLEMATDRQTRRHDSHPHSSDGVGSYIRTKSGHDAVQHLFRVVTGLDSLVAGDHQVAGQVTRAFRALSEAGLSIHPRLSRLFHVAFRTGRQARKESGLGWSQVSVPSFGVRLLEHEAGDLSNRTALLVGAGETGRLTALSLMRAGLHDMRIASRSLSRARGLASDMGVSHVDMRSLEEAVSDVDIVVSCTSSDIPVIGASEVARAVSEREGRVLHMLDLGMPRDIESGVSEIAGVRVYTLRDIERIQDEHRAEIAEASVIAERIVTESAANFMDEISFQPLLRELGVHAESARAQEVSRTFKRLSHISADDRAAIEAMTRSIVKRVLSGPIQRVRSGEWRE